MKPNGYQITKSVPGFAPGDILNVTERFGYRHHDEMELALITSSPGARTVVVTDERTGFSERNVLDATCRIGDWHGYCRTFDGGADRLETAVATDGPIRITTETLARIADPITAAGPPAVTAERNRS